MKYSLILVPALLFPAGAALFAQPQLTQQEKCILENKLEATCTYRPYPIPESAKAGKLPAYPAGGGEYVRYKAPAGYKPVYISHMGRHGSRYHTSSNPFRSVEVVLQEAENLGKLTPTGKDILERIKTLNRMSEGQRGQLTELGASEHRGIARRMVEEYRGVFRGRDSVVTFSSTSPRVIMSMDAELQAIKAVSPRTAISTHTGERYTYWLQNDLPPQFDTVYYGAHKELNVGFDISRLCGRLFTDASEVDGFFASTEVTPYRFASRLYDAIGFAACMQLPWEPLAEVFSVPELLWFSRNLSEKDYLMSERAPLMTAIMHKRTSLQMQALVAQADAALAPGSQVAAHLRFTHDSSIVPFLAALGVEGADGAYEAGHSFPGWWATYVTPMGTNIQMIFYRNGAGDVLVKVRFNERETHLTGLQAVNGVYYRWADVREKMVRESK